MNGCGQCNFNILFLKCADKTIHDVSFSILNQIDGLGMCCLVLACHFVGVNELYTRVETL